MTRLTITRDRAFAGMFRAMTILVDGKRLQTIRRGRSVELTIPAGDHVLAVQAGWLKSTLTYTAEEHHRLRANCGYRGYGGSLQLWLMLAAQDQLMW